MSSPSNSTLAFYYSRLHIPIMLVSLTYSFSHSYGTPIRMNIMMTWHKISQTWQFWHRTKVQLRFHFILVMMILIAFQNICRRKITCCWPLTSIKIAMHQSASDGKQFFLAIWLTFMLKGTTNSVQFVWHSQKLPYQDIIHFHRDALWKFIFVWHVPNARWWRHLERVFPTNQQKKPIIFASNQKQKSGSPTHKAV